MGTQVENVHGQPVAKRTSKAGVGPCVEFFFPHSQWEEMAQMVVWEETEDRSDFPGHRMEVWWKAQVQSGFGRAVFASEPQA